MLSGIVVNAHKVNAGRPPQLTGYPDFIWFTSDETEVTAALVTDVVARRIPARFGLGPGATCRCCARCTAARLAPGT